MPAAALPALRLARGKRTSGPLFVAPGTGGRLRAAACNHHWHATAREHKLPYRNPHQLRHSWASHALAAGYGIGDVARYLGDSPATVARVYAHPTGADPSAWVDAAVSPPARPRRR